MGITELELGTLLYASKGGYVGPSRMRVGSSGIAGINTSSYRGGVMGAPKVSNAAKFFDKLFTAGYLAVYEDTFNESVLVCMDGTHVIVNEDEYLVCSDFGESTSKEIIPEVVLCLASFSENEELKGAFKTAVEKYDRGEVINDEIYLFCDSFYYGHAKDKKKIRVKDSLTESEIQAAFRSGNYQPISLFNSTCKKYLGKSKYDTKTPAKKKTTSSAKKSSDFIEACKNGEFRISYEWDEELKKRIVDKSFLNTFEYTPEFEEIVRKIKFHADKIIERMDMGLTGAAAIGKDALNILILGKPGTGKTHLCFALSAALGMPVCTTVHSKHTEEDEYEGKTKIIDGHPEFVETDALLFHQKGGIDINEEINLADPSVTMGGLGQKLEYPYIVKKNGYETIVRHPLNVIIATMNVGTNGSNPLNQALANRFRSTSILGDPTKDTFIGILEKTTGKPKDLCTWVYNAYDRVVSFLCSPDVGCEEMVQNLSIRTCIGAIENMDEGQSSTRALINSIVGALAVVELETACRVKDEIIESLPPAPAVA